MHLVFVTSLVPDGSPTTGYEIANAAILDALRRAVDKVTVLGFAWPGKAPADKGSCVVLGEVDVRTDTAGPIQKLRWLGSALCKRQPFASVKLTCVSEAEISRALAAIAPYDAYVLNGIHMPAAFPGLFHDKPTIHVAHNVEHQTAAENAEAAQDMVQRLMYRREARLLETVERRVCADASFVFALSDLDREVLGLSPDRSATLPLVTKGSPGSPDRNRRKIHDAVLLGTWTWQPNRLGLEWFLDKVVPELPRGFRVAVAGRTPQDIVAAHPGVHFAGAVPDATAFLMGGAVVPLVSVAGTGVQLKTIETFELGLPAVATTRSLRGVGYLPANCRVADEPKAFAEALVELAALACDADGRDFHAEQRRLLDERIRRGLSAIAAIPVDAAA